MAKVLKTNQSINSYCNARMVLVHHVAKTPAELVQNLRKFHKYLKDSSTPPFGISEYPVAIRRNFGMPNRESRYYLFTNKEDIVMLILKYPGINMCDMYESKYKFAVYDNE